MNTRQLQGQCTHRPVASRPRRAWRRPHTVKAVADPQTIAQNKLVFTEKDYLAQESSIARQAWADSVRSITGRRHHAVWEPELNPPPLLAQVTVVLVSPRRPISAGTVARGLSCFEVEDLRIVKPRCEHLTRHAKSASKGAQYILHRAKLFDTITEATRDCDLTVAFTRWAKGCRLPFYDLTALSQHALVQSVIGAPVPSCASATPHQEGQEQQSSTTCSSTSLTQGVQQGSSSHGAADSATSSCSPTVAVDTVAGSGQGMAATGVPGAPVRVALVFGREELGMSDEEVAECDAVCSIPIGRLQESLSLSHAVSLALCTLFQARLSHVSNAMGSASPQHAESADVAAYRVQDLQGLAAGYDTSVGRER